MRWNYLLGLSYIILSFLVAFIFTYSKEQPESLKPNLFQIKPIISNDQKTVYTAQEMLNIPITTIKIVVLVSLGFSALFAFINGSDFFGRKIYTNQIRNKINWIRWVEFSITGGLMFYAVASLLGVKDGFFMLLAVACFVTVALQGGVVETFIQSGHEYMIIFPSFIVIILLAVILGVLIRSFIIRNEAIKSAGYKTPFWLYLLLTGSLSLLGSMGLIQLIYIYYVFYGKPNYKYYERAYILASLTAKSFIALVIAYGLAQFNNILNIG